MDPNGRDLLSLSGPDLVSVFRQVASGLPDDIDYDDMLAAAGLQKHSITGWHRSRAMESLLPPEGEYQAYLVTPGGVRFRRLPPYELCPGEGCNKPTRGGVRCIKCLASEEEDLWNQE